MAHLHKILTTILIDITKAQHAANVFSRQLSRQYKDDKILRSFPVPNALISTIDINLKYGVSEDSEFPPNTSASDAKLDDCYPSTNVFFKVGHIFAAVVLNKVTEQLKEKTLPEEQPEREKRQKILESLQSEKIRGALGNEIGDSLNNWYRFLRGDNEEESDNEEQINRGIAEVQQTIAETLLSNIALQEQFLPEDFKAFEDEESAFWQELKGIFEPFLSKLLTEIKIRNFLINDLLIDQSLNVFVEADKLKNLPGHALQSMNIKVNLRNYKCVLIKPGDEEDLVPED
jgi:hypothetical protein